MKLVNNKELINLQHWYCEMNTSDYEIQSVFLRIIEDGVTC